MSIIRSRLIYASLAVLVIGLGLLWRSGLLPLSDFLTKYGGDALWALVVFLGFGFIFSRSSTLRVGLIALCFAWAVEFSQLYHAPWIDTIRATRLGGLVLGASFNVPDLFAYAIGIALGALAECVYFVREPAKKTRSGNGKHMETVVIRDATAADLPALARLHVTTFNETHASLFRNGPTAEVREHQWPQMFASADGSWFCLVIETSSGKLIGFAKGQRYAHADQPDFAGELNKIYLLREYQRRGLGRQLLGHVARRFLSEGISSMLLFGDARNRSNRFYEALGADKLLAPNGEFHGGYGWRDLRKLATICPADPTVTI